MEAHDERVGWMKPKWEKRREKQRKSEQSRDETLQQRSHLINTTTNEAGSQKNLHLSNPSRAPPLTTRSLAQTPPAPTSAAAGGGRVCTSSPPPSAASKKNQNHETCGLSKACSRVAEEAEHSRVPEATRAPIVQHSPKHAVLHLATAKKGEERKSPVATRVRVGSTLVQASH